MLRGGKGLQVAVLSRGSDEREKKVLEHFDIFWDLTPGEEAEA